ncbi:aminotransferase class I/II-fold pyridoxal phosphate-dependent enzyme [Formosa sp. PL04]|uniref:aminotransferase class I/II-fold pyridoxal phosphate-dependent enzyme n=1 Tax=Formosa sp. PL04 TaxID=3081755 RepID=UPI002980BF97|nr:aminotransferase class I/II-fold pyridoxal phosphate-dependent enzyme [Formosa sp. PL04]MDW5288005.1 aminotransferase class I/II-fold pyridoxal phosphate-dependent enzyme [Formosa sp. PL04]
MEVIKAPNAKLFLKTKSMSYFGSTSYLGLATLPAFQDAVINGIKKWGTAYGSSRHANVKLSIFNDAEMLLSSQLKTEACVTVSSGMLAGKLTIDFLAQSNSKFYHYPNTHPAILAPNSLPLFINTKLHPTLLTDTIENIVISVDAIPTASVTVVNFSFLKSIPKQKNITLLVDESHSIGITGESGMGIFSSIPKSLIAKKIMVASLGKAMGLPGGIIAGNASFINAIKETTIFTTASGMSPAYLEAYLQSQAIYKEQKDKLKNNLLYFFEDLNLDETFLFNPNYPNIYNLKPGFYNYLLNKNIAITHFKYPTPNDVLSRIMLSANHSKIDLDLLKKLLINPLT